MASTEVYTSDKELEDLYNSLDKGSLVRLLIEKHRELEKQVKNLALSGVSKSVNCDLCGNTGYLITENGEVGEDCYKCDK